MKLSVNVSGENQAFDLKFLRAQKICEEDSANCLYGVRVEKYIDGILAEEADSGPITEDLGFIDSIMASLYENSVTPMVLYETLDEMLA